MNAMADHSPQLGSDSNGVGGFGKTRPYLADFSRTTSSQGVAKPKRLSGRRQRSHAYIELVDATPHICTFIINFCTLLTGAIRALIELSDFSPSFRCNLIQPSADSPPITIMILLARFFYCLIFTFPSSAHAARHPFIFRPLLPPIFSQSECLLSTNTEFSVSCSTAGQSEILRANQM